MKNVFTPTFDSLVIHPPCFLDIYNRCCGNEVMDILGLEWGMELRNDRNEIKQENIEYSRCYVYRMLKRFCGSTMVTNDSHRETASRLVMSSWASVSV